MGKEFYEEPQFEPLSNPYNFSEDQLYDLSNYLRKKVFEICIQSGAGHVGGSSSSVELMTTLYFGGILNFDPNNLRHPNRDRVLVRGHLGPLRYPIFALLGEVQEEELSTYRQFDSRLQGHEEYQLIPGIDITPSGSLGMLLSYGVGASVAAKESEKSYKTYVFLGDGEEQEGNISEAARHAAKLNLNNLVAILDKNGKQLSNPTSVTDKSDAIKTWQGYGWETLEIQNGHDINEILETFEKTKQQNKPILIVANTIKGYGLANTENHFSGYHTIGTCPKDIQKEGLQQLEEIVGESDISSSLSELNKVRDSVAIVTEEKQFTPINLSIEPTDSTSTNTDDSQVEYFQRLKEILTSQERHLPFFFLTADVTRHDLVEALEIKDYATFFNVGIREQHMIGMAHGLSLSYPSARILINSNDAFVYRSIDQLNALCQGEGNVIIIGDLAGITNSRNGKTHQTTGQPGAILSMPGIKMLEPGDVRDLYNCLNWALGESRGAVYIRMHRSDVQPFTRNPEDNYNTRYYVAHNPQADVDVTIIASGYTVGPSIEAAKHLEDMGVSAQVLNIIDHKSPDEDFSRLLPNDKPVLTVYNGAPHVLQSNIAKVVMEHSISRPSKIIGHGFNYGTTGKVDDLARRFKLDKEGIVELVVNTANL